MYILYIFICYLAIYYVLITIIVDMELKDFLRQAHRIIEATDNRDYRQSDMAKAIDCNERTYGEYLRGGLNPSAMKTLLNLLAKLKDEDLIKVIRAWESEKNEVNK